MRSTIIVQSLTLRVTTNHKSRFESSNSTVPVVLDGRSMSCGITRTQVVPRAETADRSAQARRQSSFAKETMSTKKYVEDAMKEEYEKGVFATSAEGVIVYPGGDPCPVTGKKYEDLEPELELKIAKFMEAFLQLLTSSLTHFTTVGASWALWRGRRRRGLRFARAAFVWRKRPSPSKRKFCRFSGGKGSILRF